ncbi:MAG: type II toxin-antitoxin system VapC family toxin [Nitrospinota bacterium]
MISKVVLDSYAVLAYFYEEQGSDSLKNLLNLAKQNKANVYFNEINLGEAYYRVWKDSGEVAGKEALQLCLGLPIEVVSVDREFIIKAAEIKAQNKVSYADAFCVATAKREKCPVVTGDPEFASVRDLEIIWIKDLKVVVQSNHLKQSQKEEGEKNIQ